MTYLSEENRRRAARGRTWAKRYARAWVGEQHGTGTADELMAPATDLIADVIHGLAEMGVEPELVIARARQTWQGDLEDEPAGPELPTGYPFHE